MITYKNSDIFLGDEDVIAHGVNCSGGFGSGIAKQISEKYPEVREKYLEKFNTEGWKLGEIQVVPQNNKIIINCSTQQYYGSGASSGKVYVSYSAIRESFIKLRDYCLKNNKTLSIPKIGAGLAGGNWAKIEEIIDDVFEDMPISVYVFNPVKKEANKKVKKEANKQESKESKALALSEEEKERFLFLKNDLKNFVERVDNKTFLIKSNMIIKGGATLLEYISLYLKSQDIIGLNQIVGVKYQILEIRDVFLGFGEKNIPIILDINRLDANQIKDGINIEDRYEVIILDFSKRHTDPEPLRAFLEDTNAILFVYDDDKKDGLASFIKSLKRNYNLF